MFDPVRVFYRRSPVLLLLVSAVLLSGLSACDSDSNGGDEHDPALDGGIVATFTNQDETFRVWITNETTIQQVLALQAGTSDANIPNGKILHGPGVADHNEPWSWHLDPEDIEMADLTIEVCDGRPSYVEENVDEFVDVVDRYCPWGAELVDVEDYR